MFIWGQFIWTESLISSLNCINMVFCIVFVTQNCTGPVFANVLMWPGGTCWRRQHRWRNDPVVSLIKDWWHNPLSLYLFLSLIVFCSPSSFLTCSAIPAAQDDRKHICVSQSEYGNIGLWKFVVLCVCQGLSVNVSDYTAATCVCGLTAPFVPLPWYLALIFLCSNFLPRLI